MLAPPAVDLQKRDLAASNEIEVKYTEVLGEVNFQSSLKNVETKAKKKANFKI